MYLLLTLEPQSTSGPPITLLLLKFSGLVHSTPHLQFSVFFHVPVDGLFVSRNGLNRTSYDFLLRNTYDPIFFTSSTCSDPRSFSPDPISHFFIDSLIHNRIFTAVCRVAIIRGLKKLAHTEDTSHHQPEVKNRPK